MPDMLNETFYEGTQVAFLFLFYIYGFLWTNRRLTVTPI